MSDVVFDAVGFAAGAHRGQRRKSTRVPYGAHARAGAARRCGWGCDDVVGVAGLLHDVVEDTPVTLEERARTFGAEVAALVEVVTEPDKALPWEARKGRTIAAVRAGTPGAL